MRILEKLRFDRGLTGLEIGWREAGFARKTGELGREFGGSSPR